MILCQLLNKAAVGGAEIYAALIANRYAEDGGESHVVVMGAPGDISGRFAPNVHVHYLNFQRESIRNPLRFIASLWRGYSLLSRAVKGNNIQVLQTHLPTTNLWGLVLQLTRACQVVVTIHNNNFLHSPDGTALGSFLKFRAYRFMIRVCPVIVAVSSRVRDSLIQTLGIPEERAEKIVVVSNGVPAPATVSGSEIETLKRNHGISDETCWLVAAGRLTEAKNFSCLVRASQFLDVRGLDFMVTIAGEGELRADLEKQVRDLGLEGRIRMPGNLDNLSALMAAADILVMPSRWEGLPLVLLEAMAVGLPVVGSRINGLQDIIHEGVEGYLCEVDDADCLAEKIARIMGDEALKSRLGRASRSLFSERFDFERVYGELVGIYSRIYPE